MKLKACIILVCILSIDLHFHSDLGFSMSASDPLVLVDAKGNNSF